MALKRKITKAVFDKMSDDVKEHYVASDDGKSYELEAEGFDDAEEMRRARDREKQTAKEAKTKLAAAEERLAELEGDDVRKSGDIKKIEDSWKAKLDKAVTEGATKLETAHNFIRKTLRDATAESLAAKISNAPAVMKRILADRLTVDFEGDEPKLVVLDAEGKASALKVDDLQKEVVANKEYAAIVIANRASGGA